MMLSTRAINENVSKPISFQSSKKVEGRITEIQSSSWLFGLEENKLAYYHRYYQNENKECTWCSNTLRPAPKEYI